MGTHLFSQYEYVGPKAIREAAGGTAPGTVLRKVADLDDWLRNQGEALTDGATYVVDTKGDLRVAPRRSEYVACAGGSPVLAAGEIRFERGRSNPFVAEISNQSTGYCPEPDCWPAVASALHTAGIEAPPSFTQTFIFRRCPRCGERNLVKDDWFVCALCEADLPREWNFGSRS
jgi:hypothetical protein